MYSSCRYQCTAKAGTLFDKTRTPLKDWLAAIWYITNQKSGVSALGLQGLLGLGSYQTAWSMLHRLRRAMVVSERGSLSGVVEVDETFLSARNDARGHAPQLDSKNIVIIVAVELLEPKGFGRIRLGRVNRASQADVIPFIKKNIEPKTLIHTDGSPIYGTLQDHGYRRNKFVQIGSPIPPHKTLPGVHRIASLLKRWLLGTHQGSIQPKQLDHYLYEYTFRFNRRKSRSRGLLFYRLLESALETNPVTYKDILQG
ncbi:IS1595 family transposase [Candidatus Enterovibrio escicola]|uniref:IS1595 family transposase n=1 Tax=Candidatus Enterovibrio escicola TaxID=1927127 RepID=UPI001CC24FB6|nr:IS1595 family transposase [Candidatus Enterovibrio escacola]